MPGGGRPQLRLRGAEADVAYLEDYAERHGGLAGIVRALRERSTPTTPRPSPARPGELPPIGEAIKSAVDQMLGYPTPEEQQAAQDARQAAEAARLGEAVHAAHRLVTGIVTSVALAPHGCALLQLVYGRLALGGYEDEAHILAHVAGELGIPEVAHALMPSDLELNEFVVALRMSRRMDLHPRLEAVLRRLDEKRDRLGTR